MNYETLEPNKYYLVYPDGRRVIFMGMENAYIVKTSAGDIKVSEADLLKVEEIKDKVYKKKPLFAPVIIINGRYVIGTSLYETKEQALNSETRVYGVNEIMVEVE